MSADTPLPAVHTVADLSTRIASWRAEGRRIGFVPTMGALHAGHLALVSDALERADRVIASVFVNPTQFAPGEDFDSYPRTLDADAAKLAEAGCHLLYAPTAREMYPEGFATTVSVAGPAEGLESEARPHFFAGVATVVAKLLNQVRPDVAVFGEKDYQQLLVVRRLAADLDLGVEIAAGATVREPDGLALSSRNAYLDAADRTRAARLNVILKELAEALASGTPVDDAIKTARAAAGEAFDAVDYVEARDAETLAELPPGPVDRPARVLAAVRLGDVRLIDNMAV
ncbi:pantoate--beta-alanine ligase [Marinicauda salina]|uniref:Pantothenate synthetase n=1 Tax=Marinicauda salina TaxID=2135793 RepID=A0A2U2BR60_9PROT|nr:pantoate--beta-alanine ligase [Marinicauda salina]PWE16494.1 pantoate--beta-alanine ligase [Marinicauda salina]